jgi:chemotaxis protein CheD
MTTPANPDPALKKNVLIVAVAEFQTTNNPASELIAHLIGSGLAVVALDSTHKVGGLLHTLLPDSTVDPSKAAQTPALFVDTGIPLLMQAITQLGAKRDTLLIKIAGGAQFLDEKSVFNLGQRNSQAAKSALARLGFTPQHMDIGGKSSRTVRLDLAAGRITIEAPGASPSDI